jgi:IclR family transcriptional regulator, pca regulon regulatory protein
VKPDRTPATDATRPEPGQRAGREQVIALERGLAVIAAFDTARRRLSMAEVATLCGLSRATARRYLHTLENLGFVVSERNMYALTAKTLRLGQSYMYSSRLPRLVDPELQRLAREAGQASSAGVLDGDDVICIAAIMAGPMVSSTLQPGTRVPAYCTANGRMLVAALPEPEREAWLHAQRLAARTEHTIVDAGRLADEVDTARGQGWCLVDRELEPDLLTLSVPLLNHPGETVAAINLSVEASQVPTRRLIEQGLPLLMKAQQTLRGLL